jgi:hypothetical protein
VSDLDRVTLDDFNAVAAPMPGPWTPRNLAELEERPPVEPTIGQVGLVYPGRRHVFSGPQETAKTLAAYIVSLEEIRHGGIVVLVDLEMGPWDARDRLRDLGATCDELAELHYIEPDTPPTPDNLLGLIALAPSLVIIDAAAGAFELAGLDDHKRADVEKFAGLYVRPFWRLGVATITLDHVVKATKERGGYAIGSERKVGGADVHLGFEPIRKLTRGGSGLYRIVTHKDRLGHLPRPRAAELELRSDPDTHSITWELRPADPGSDQSFRPTALMEKVSLYVESCNSDRPSRNAVEQAVTGKRDYCAWPSTFSSPKATSMSTRGHATPGYFGPSSLTARPTTLPTNDLAPPRPDFAPGDVLVPPRDFAPPPTRGRSRRGEVRRGRNAATSPPAAAELLANPGALLTRTHLRELGLQRRAVDAVFRACPVIVLPGYSRPVVRVRDYLALLDESTFDGRTRVRARSTMS